MDVSNFFLMRHEIILLAVILLLIIGEIFIAQNKKSSIVHLGILLFGIHTIRNIPINLKQSNAEPLDLSAKTKDIRAVPHPCLQT